MLEHDELRRLCGDVADWKLAAIEAIGASREEVEEALAWVAGESDVMGEERRPAAGKVAQVYDILSAEEESWQGDRETGPAA